MMFQRFGPDKSDGDFGSFYGLALPFLMRGMPIEPVQMELAKLDSYKLLLLTYEGMKPVDAGRPRSYRQVGQRRRRARRRRR